MWKFLPVESSQAKRRRAPFPAYVTRSVSGFPDYFYPQPLRQLTIGLATAPPMPNLQPRETAKHRQRDKNHCPIVVAGCVTRGQVNVTSRQVSGEGWEYAVSHRCADPEWQRNAKKFHDGASGREDL